MAFSGRLMEGFPGPIPTRAKALEDVTQRLTSARDWAQSQADAWEARAGELEVKYQEAIRPKGFVHWLRTRLGV